jgi:hypothetical protein
MSVRFRARSFAAAALLLASTAGLGIGSYSIAFARGATAQKTASEVGAFAIVYPGFYSDREKPLVEAYLRDNAALKSRGPINVAALVAGSLPKDTPGLGPVIPVTEEWLRYNAQKYAPDNPLYSDKAYALNAGFNGLPAFPTFGAHDDTFMVPFPRPLARMTIRSWCRSLLVRETNFWSANSTTTFVHWPRSMPAIPCFSSWTAARSSI